MHEINDLVGPFEHPHVPRREGVACSQGEGLISLNDGAVKEGRGVRAQVRDLDSVALLGGRRHGRTPRLRARPPQELRTLPRL